MACCLIEVTCFKVHLTQDNIHRNKAQLCVYILILVPVSRTDIDIRAIIRNLQARILFKVRCQLRYYTIDVKLRIIAAVNLGNGDKRLSKERNLTIDLSQLEISPGTKRLNGSILIDHHVCTSRKQGRITMCYVIITVVDYTIIYVCTIITIRSVSREIPQLTKIVIRVIGRIHQITLHLSLEDILVCQLLHCLHYTVCEEDGVGLLV